LDFAGVGLTAIEICGLSRLRIRLYLTLKIPKNRNMENRYNERFILPPYSLNLLFYKPINTILSQVQELKQGFV
jgi:hypothetical protein